MTAHYPDFVERAEAISGEDGRLADPRPGVYGRAFKRLLDILAVLAAAPVVLPVVAVLALLVARDGHAPFFRQARVGRGGRIFTLWKLRSMVPDAEARLAGLRDTLYDGPIVGGVMNTLVFLAALTVPLILLIVGYGIQLDQRGIREAVTPVVIRLAILLPLAVLLPVLLADSLLDGNAYSQAALFTLLILPPPFIIPLYMKPGMPDERRYVNNVLSLSTMVSVFLFVTYVTINPL